MSFQLFSDYEIKTRELFETYRRARDPREITGAEIAVMDVFRAKAASALTSEQIETIAKALHSIQTLDVKPALLRLVRAKALRSYSSRGERLYEVNY